MTTETGKGASMTGVAGAVAECLWEDRYWGLDNVDWYDPGTMSDSDWRSARCEPGSPDRAFFSAVEKVAALFRYRDNEGPLWPALTQTALSRSIAIMPPIGTSASMRLPAAAL